MEFQMLPQCRWGIQIRENQESKVTTSIGSWGHTPGSKTQMPLGALDSLASFFNLFVPRFTHKTEWIIDSTYLTKLLQGLMV